MILTEQELTRERAEEVTGDINKDYKVLFDEEISNIIVELKSILRDSDLLGIAAPHIGINKRIFCMKFKDSYQTFINPSIKDLKQLALSRETDPSIPNKEYLHFRANEIKYDYVTPLGEMKTASLMGKASFIFQQLVDVLDGMLTSDLGLEVDEDFDNAPDEVKDEIIEMYRDALNKAQEAANEVIQSDEELSKMKSAIEYTQKMRSGEILVRYDKVTEEQAEKIREKIQEASEQIQEESKKKRGRPKKESVKDDK